MFDFAIDFQNLNSLYDLQLTFTKNFDHKRNTTYLKRVSFIEKKSKCATKTMLLWREKKLAKI